MVSQIQMSCWPLMGKKLLVKRALVHHCFCDGSYPIHPLVIGRVHWPWIYAGHSEFVHWCFLTRCFPTSAEECPAPGPLGVPSGTPTFQSHPWEVFNWSVWPPVVVRTAAIG